MPTKLTWADIVAEQTAETNNGGLATQVVWPGPSREGPEENMGLGECSVLKVKHNNNMVRSNEETVQLTASFDEITNVTQKPTDMPLPLDMEHDGTTSRQTGLFDHGKEQRHSSLPALDDLRTIAASSREAAPSPLKADGSVTRWTREPERVRRDSSRRLPGIAFELPRDSSDV